MGLFDRFKRAAEPLSNKTVITAPVSGELLQLSETTEPVFSSEMMGKGVAINPSEATIIARSPSPCRTLSASLPITVSRC